MRAQSSPITAPAERLKRLHKMAVAAMKNAHAPYSKFKVGAALFTTDGKYFSGCNVENASYGGTVCAERVAIWKSVSEGAQGDIVDIVIVASGKEAWPPCGFCRQVLTEFAEGSCRVHLATAKKITKSYTLDELMPASFTGKNLKA